MLNVAGKFGFVFFQISQSQKSLWKFARVRVREA
jgi:hypothetical protein